MTRRRAALLAVALGVACEGPTEPAGALRVYVDRDPAMAAFVDSAWSANARCLPTLDGSFGWRHIAWFSVPGDTGWTVGSVQASGEYGVEHGVHVIWLDAWAYDARTRDNPATWWIVRHELLHDLLQHHAMDVEHSAPFQACGLDY